MSQRTRRQLVTLLLLMFAACSSPAEGPAKGEAPAAAPAAPAAESKVALASDRPGLPAELSADDLREVLEPAKVAARQSCKGLARSRERVEVELTIAGSSGAVSHTNVGLHGGNPELASCVANELARSTFKSTRKAATRTTVAVNF